MIAKTASEQGVFKALCTRLGRLKRLLVDRQYTSRGQAIVEFSILAPFMLFVLILTVGRLAIGLYSLQLQMTEHTLNNILNDPNPAADFNTSLIQYNIGKLQNGSLSLTSKAYDQKNLLDMLNGTADDGTTTQFSLAQLKFSNWYAANKHNVSVMTPQTLVLQFPPPGSSIPSWIGSPIFFTTTTTTIETNLQSNHPIISKMFFNLVGINLISSVSNTSFRPAGIQTMMHCYRDIHDTITNTLKPDADTIDDTNMTQLGVAGSTVTAGNVPLVTLPIGSDNLCKN